MFPGQNVRIYSDRIFNIIKDSRHRKPAILPYVFVSALRFLNLSRKILSPQHMGGRSIYRLSGHGKGVRALAQHPTSAYIIQDWNMYLARFV